VYFVIRTRPDTYVLGLPCSTREEMRNSDNRSIPKSEEEIQFGNPARRWRDDIKMDLKEKAVGWLL